MTAKTKHGGKRKGAGRKPAPIPVHTKKLRATQKDWKKFLKYMTGDAKTDFDEILIALEILDIYEPPLL